MEHIKDAILLNNQILINYIIKMYKLLDLRIQ
jgi:hypothetical protein